MIYPAFPMNYEDTLTFFIAFLKGKVNSFLSPALKNSPLKAPLANIQQSIYRDEDRDTGEKMVKMVD